MNVCPPVQELAVAKLRSAVKVEPRAAAEPKLKVLLGEVAPMVELTRLALVMTPALVREPMLKPPERESEVP